MADISKIKTLDGTTYDIKDATARANSGVTGVKGNAESSYRTGQVNITPANVGAVSLSGNETISGDKTFSGTTTLSKSAVVSTPENTFINAQAQGLYQSPIPKYLWHDLFSFCRYSVPTYETTTDGATWTVGTVNQTHFAQLENRSIPWLTSTICGVRLTWQSNSFAYCGAKWMALGVSYSYPLALYTVKVEFSADGTTWTTQHESQPKVNQAPTWLYLKASPGGNDTRIRLTVTKATTDTGVLNVGAVKLLTSRWGGQGAGSEFEYPYDWDTTPNIVPISNNGSDLGSSSKKWAHVYATSFNGALTGNVTGNVSGTAANVTGVVAVANGGTGATTVAGAIESLGAATAKDVKEVYSRGEQLVINGNGFMGDNSNFSELTFDGSKANGSPGSFTTTASSKTVDSDAMFPVDPSKRYKAEFDVMAEEPGAAMYAMLMFYDVDKKLMSVQHVSYFDGSTTTLAQDLKNGDTKVYLTSAAGFHNTTASHERSLIFWNYTNSFGYTYPPETYSRNFYSGLWASDSSVDKTNNMITLSAAWNKGTIPAGTPVSQNMSGSNYSYFWYITNKASFPREWTHISGEYNGVRTSGTANGTGKFWPGTAYCKIGWLWNHTNGGTGQGRIWVTNVSVKMADADNVTGIVQPAHGGTGETNLTNSANALINALSTGTNTPSDADYYVSQYANGGTSTTTYHRRPVSALWTYIKGKISSWMKNLTAKGTLGWTSSSNDTMPITSNTLAYWNGCYTGTSSNLEYCAKGAFGNAAVAGLSTSTSSTSTTNAATSSAVKTAYDLANQANGTANTALSGVNGTLIYDHTYTIANGVATFTAHVYCKGQEVTSNYQDSAFSWSYRLSDAISETGTPSVVSLGTGKTKTINITTLGLGGHVIGTFTTD